MPLYQDLFDKLEQLVTPAATSGFEQEVVRVLHRFFAPSAESVEVDPFGNVYGTLNTGGAPRIMVVAHNDSVGMITSHVEESGYLRFDTVGAVPPNLVYAQRVIIHTPEGPVTGVVGSKPGHLSWFNDWGRTVPDENLLFIDVGARTAAEARAMGLEAGQQVTWDRSLAWLGGPQTGLVTGRSLDDRLGCLVLVEVLERLRARQREGEALAPEVIFVAASQEEVGCRGAQIAAQRIKPDLCIGLDATISAAGAGLSAGIAPHPSTAFSEAATDVGAGPGISMFDRGRMAGLLGHPAINALLLRVARESGIAHQVEGSMPGITSDASTIHLEEGGIPSVTIKIPSRYTHGPVEVSSLADVAATIDLVVAALAAMPSGFKADFVSI